MAVRDGNRVCGTCYTVVDRLMDYGAEWRFYGAEDAGNGACNPTRCCPPTGRLISGLGSIISGGARRHVSSWSNRTEASARAAEASQASRRSVQRYQVWSSLTYRERVLCGVFDVLSVSAARHDLPACILEEAKTLYKTVSEAHITRGTSRAAVIACSVYVACKKCGAPRCLREVAEMFDLPRATMTKACRLFHDIVLDADQTSSVPADFVGRFCSVLGLPPHVVDLTRLAVERAEDLSLACDAMPPSVVAGCILLACAQAGIFVNRAAVSKACVVAPVTAAKMYKRLSPYADLLTNF
jgi:transcription initiation factor TFIIB